MVKKKIANAGKAAPLKACLLFYSFWLHMAYDSMGRQAAQNGGQEKEEYGSL